MSRVRRTKSAPINKVDEANRIVHATLLAPDVPDLQADVISLDEIRAAALGFMTQYQVVGEQHTKEAKAQVVESYVDEAGWHVATQIHDDELWKKIQTREYTGKSVGGYAWRERDGNYYRLKEFEVLEYSIVDRPAVPSAVFKAWDADEDETSLSQKIVDGMVSSRVAFQKALASFGAQIFKLVNTSATEGREETEQGGSEMTEEQMKELLEQLKAELKAEFTIELEERFKALGNDEAEDAEGVSEADAVELGARFDEMQDQIAGVVESNESLAKSVEDLVEAIKNLPQASGKQHYDGGDEEEQKPNRARCAV